MAQIFRQFKPRCFMWCHHYTRSASSSHVLECIKYASKLLRFQISLIKLVFQKWKIRAQKNHIIEISWKIKCFWVQELLKKTTTRILMNNTWSSVKEYLKIWTSILNIVYSYHWTIFRSLYALIILLFYFICVKNILKNIFKIVKNIFLFFYLIF